MNNRKEILRAVAVAVHVLAAAAFVLLYLKTGGMTVICLVSAVLIACASVPARPGRPVTHYMAFGVLTGYAFWVCVAAVHRRDFLSLVPAVLLIAGAAWWLQAPCWPATLFAGTAVVVSLGLAVLQYQYPLEPGFDPQRVRRAAITSLGILSVGLVYLGLGTVEAMWRAPRKAKRIGRRGKRPEVEQSE
jgi:hypothetical protein